MLFPLGRITKAQALETARVECERRGWQWSEPVVTRGLVSYTIWPSGRGTARGSGHGLSSPDGRDESRRPGSLRGSAASYEIHALSSEDQQVKRCAGEARRGSVSPST